MAMAIAIVITPEGGNHSSLIRGYKLHVVLVDQYVCWILYKSRPIFSYVCLPLSLLKVGSKHADRQTGQMLRENGEKKTMQEK